MATDPAEIVADGAAAGQPSAETMDPAAAVPETTEATPEATPGDELLAQRAHYPTLAPVEATPDAAVPGSTDMAPAMNEPALAVPSRLANSPAPGLRTANDPPATGSAERTAFPIAAAPPPATPLPVAQAPVLNLPLPGGSTPDSTVPQQIPPSPVARAPRLVIEMPESADATPGAPEPVDSTDSTVQAPSQAAPSATVPAATPGPAPVQGLPPALIRPGASVTEDDTAGPPAPAAEGSLAEGGPAAAAAGAVSAQTAPAPAFTAHAVGQATEPAPTVVASPSAHAGVGPVDPIEVPSTTAAPARTQSPLPLHRQLLGPIATLAAGPNGERTLSVNIAPEALGPITVKAHLGSEGIRMDLSAPTEAGREALRAMLPELRRELAASGGGNITLNTTADDSAAGGNPRGESFGGGGEPRAAPGPRSTALPGRTAQPSEFIAQPETPTHRATSHLDVMA